MKYDGNDLQLWESQARNHWIVGADIPRLFDGWKDARRDGYTLAYTWGDSAGAKIMYGGVGFRTSFRSATLASGMAVAVAENLVVGGQEHHDAGLDLQIDSQVLAVGGLAIPSGGYYFLDGSRFEVSIAVRRSFGRAYTRVVFRCSGSDGTALGWVSKSWMNNASIYDDTSKDEVDNVLPLPPGPSGLVNRIDLSGKIDSQGKIDLSNKAVTAGSSGSSGIVEDVLLGILRSPMDKIISMNQSIDGYGSIGASILVQRLPGRVGWVAEITTGENPMRIIGKATRISGGDGQWKICPLPRHRSAGGIPATVRYIRCSGPLSMAGLGGVRLDKGWVLYPDGTTWNNVHGEMGMLRALDDYKLYLGNGRSGISHLKWDTARRVMIRTRGGGLDGESYWDARTWTYADGSVLVVGCDNGSCAVLNGHGYVLAIGGQPMIYPGGLSFLERAVAADPVD